MSDPTAILARLALLDPTNTEAQLSRALDAYLDGKAVELLLRCEMPRTLISSALTAYQTTRGRLRALGRLLDEMGVPG